MCAKGVAEKFQRGTSIVGIASGGEAVGGSSALGQKISFVQVMLGEIHGRRSVDSR